MTQTQTSETLEIEEISANFHCLKVGGRENQALTQIEFVGVRQVAEENQKLFLLAALVDFGPLAQKLGQPVYICQMLQFTSIFTMRGLLDQYEDFEKFMNSGEILFIENTVAYFSQNAWESMAKESLSIAC